MVKMTNGQKEKRRRDQILARLFNGPGTVSEISKIGIPQRTVYNILKKLQGEGLVLKGGTLASETQAYVPGYHKSYRTAGEQAIVPRKFVNEWLSRGWKVGSAFDGDRVVVEYAPTIDLGPPDFF